MLLVACWTSAYWRKYIRNGAQYKQYWSRAPEVRGSKVWVFCIEDPAAVEGYGASWRSSQVLNTASSQCNTYTLYRFVHQTCGHISKRIFKQLPHRSVTVAYISYLHSYKAKQSLSSKSLLTKVIGKTYFTSDKWQHCGENHSTRLILVELLWCWCLVTPLLF